MALPEIRSEWRHKDGRVLRVDEVRQDPRPDQSVALMTLLNAKRGQRNNPVMQLSRFEDGTLTPEHDDRCSDLHGPSVPCIIR
jgi:hypothetical protein